MANALIPELAVTDIEVSLRFYCSILGFEVAYQRPAEGFAMLRIGTGELMLDQIGIGRTFETGPLERPFGRGINLQIAVGDLDTLHARVGAAGVPLMLPLETKSYDVLGRSPEQRQFCVQDPDGYLLRFCELAA